MILPPSEGERLSNALVRWHDEAPGLAPCGEGTLRARLLCFGRTMVVGFWANVLDFALLALCLRWLHIEALSSRLIALLVSGVLTFIASRSFAFRAQGGNAPQQAGRFLVAELAAVPLNLLSFHLCAAFAPLAAAEIVSFVANGLVFVAFSYPVRRLLVFGAVAPSNVVT
jgi:putative flippase GtrA